MACLIRLELITYSIFAVCVYGARTRIRTQNLALIWCQTEHKSAALPIELYGDIGQGTYCPPTGFSFSWARAIRGAVALTNTLKDWWFH